MSRTEGSRAHRAPRWSSRRRRGLLIISVGLVLVGVLAAVAVLVLTSEDEDVPATERLGPEVVETTGRGPLPPESDVWIGAWSTPTEFTQAGRVEAVQSFEQRIGRPLDVVNSFHDWTDDFPTEADRAVVQSGHQLMVSWAGTDTRTIASGRYDDQIRGQARAVRDLGVPMLIRWRWEMDRPNLQASVWSPEDYIAAWDRLRRIFTEEGATNAGWVWCPLASGFDDGRAEAYYPGDDQVDWLCADVYPGVDKRTFDEDSAAFLTWAEAHPRPVMIGEFGAEADDPRYQGHWLDGAHAVLAVSWQVRAVVYFEGRLEADNVKGKAPFDYTLAEDSPGLAAFSRLADELARRGPRPDTASSSLSVTSPHVQ